MVAPVAALAGSGLFSSAMPVLGSVVSGLFGRRSASKQNAMQMAMAREQMAFQERMSSTAHQREVQDLLAAGLNPILSGTGGAGSSSPSGAMAPIVGEEEMEGLGQAASSAMAAKLMAQQLKNAQSEGDILRSKAGMADIDFENYENYARGNAKAESERNRTAAQIAGLQVPELEAVAKLWKDLGEGGELFKAIGAAGPTMGPLIRTVLQMLMRRQ